MGDRFIIRGLLVLAVVAFVASVAISAVVVAGVYNYAVVPQVAVIGLELPENVSITPFLLIVAVVQGFRCAAYYRSRKMELDSE